MNYREQWQDQGYLVVKNVLDAERIRQLFEVCETAFAQWREESSPDIEPGCFAYGPSAWVQLHLNHPKYHRQNDTSLACVLDAVANPLAMEITRDIFQEAPMFMQANYYIDPPGETRIGNWHRDSQFFANGDEAVERQAVADEAEPPRELHMHIPLVPTQASELVPGSHNRWDTPREREIRLNDPVNGEMPGALKLQLEPGDLAFFHVNAIHRGMYLQGVPRRTIAVTFSRSSIRREATAQSMKAWNGYIASFQPWTLKPGYLDGTSSSAQDLFGRFIEAYRDNWKPEYLSELEPQRQAYFRDF